MKVTETKNEGLKKGFKIVVPAADVAEKVTVKIKEIGQNAAIPGFRKGHAPESFLRQRYEKAATAEVVDELVQQGASDALSSRSLRPAVRPKIEIVAFDKDKDLEFTLDVEVIPEIADTDFSKITLEKLKAEAPAEEVEKALERLASARSDTKPVTEKRPAKKGDVTVIDFEGSVDGVKFDGGKGTDYSLELGSGSFIPGFEDQIVGHNAGDKFDVNVTFPKEYHAENLAGKNAVFAVEIKELRVKTPAVMDEKFAQSFGKKTMDELKTAIREELSREYDAVASNDLKRKLLDALAGAHDFEVPETMANAEFDDIWKQLENAKKNNRLDEDDKNKTDDELKTQYRAIAERRVRLGLLLADIGMKNKITVTDADLNRAIMAEARNFPGQEKAVFEFYAKHPEMTDRLRAPLFEEKVVDFILKAVKLVEKAVTPEELYKAAADGEKETAPAKKPAKKAAAKKEKAEKPAKEEKPAKAPAKKTTAKKKKAAE